MSFLNPYANADSETLRLKTAQEATVDFMKRCRNGEITLLDLDNAIESHREFLYDQFRCNTDTKFLKQNAEVIIKAAKTSADSAE